MTKQQDNKPSKPVGYYNRPGLKSSMEIPVNLERVLLQAAKDPELLKDLLINRDEALNKLSIDMRPSERAMLTAMPASTLKLLIEKVQPNRLGKSRFAKQVATAVAGSLLISTGCTTAGISPDLPRDANTASADSGTEDSNVDSGTTVTRGISPDMPPDAGNIVDASSDGSKEPTSDGGSE